MPSISALAKALPGFSPIAYIISRCRAKKSRKVTVGAIKLPSASTASRNIRANAQGPRPAKRLFRKTIAARRRKPVSLREKVIRNEKTKNQMVVLPKEAVMTPAVPTPGSSESDRRARTLGQVISTNSHNSTVPRKMPSTPMASADRPPIPGRKRAKKASRTPARTRGSFQNRFIINKIASYAAPRTNPLPQSAGCGCPGVKHPDKTRPGTRGHAP